MPTVYTETKVWKMQRPLSFRVGVMWILLSTPGWVWAQPSPTTDVLPVQVYIAGEEVMLGPATEPQIQALQSVAEPDRHVMAVLLQDMEGQVAQYQFIFQTKDLDKLRQGGMLIVAFSQKKHADILGLQLGIVSGFERFYLNPVGVSLQDAMAQPTEPAVFGFGLLRE